MTLIYLSSAWVAGIYLGSKIALPIAIISLGLLPLCLIPFLSQHKKPLLLAGFCLFALLGGSLSFQSSLPAIDEHHLQFYNDRGIVEIEGTICNYPESRDKASIFQFSVSKLETEGTKKELSGKALVRVPRYHDYHYGDILKITGKLETPPRLDDFDYQGYLARQGIYSLVNYPRIEVIDTGKGSTLMTWIYSLRDNLSRSLSFALPEPQGSLAQGILLGIRSNIPHPLREAFSRTGTAHLLAISGLHLSIIIGILVASGIWLFGRRYYIYIWLALVVIWAYALVTGMNPPVVRGAVMGTMFLIGEYLGRQRSALTALAFAAAVMVGIQPQILWQASFQLSFLAMTALVFLFPYLRTRRIKDIATNLDNRTSITSLRDALFDSLTVTLVATLATWPIIAYNFGIVSFVSLPATLFSLLALPGIIITSAIVSVAGLFAPVLAQILGWVAWLFLSYLVMVVQAFDALPFSSAEIHNIQIWQIWCYYGLLITVMAIINYRRQLADFFSPGASQMQRLAGKASGLISNVPKKWIVPPLLIAAILVWTAAFSMPDNRLHVSILDVRQGDAILVQTPSRQNILIDGGPSPQAISLELDKKLPFWDRTIDLVILTQPQADHVTGLVEVLQSYNVQRVIEPGVAYSSAIYQKWLELTGDAKIEYKIARSGQEINLGDGIKMEVLHPPPFLLQGTSDDVDNNGMVLRLSWNRVSFIFTADIREEAEWHLIAHRANLKSTVLKVAHHGSRTSTSPEFLAVVAPRVAAISAGTDNRFSLPNTEVVDRLTRRLGNDSVYLTAEDSTIEFITDGERLWVKLK